MWRELTFSEFCAGFPTKEEVAQPPFSREALNVLYRLYMKEEEKIGPIRYDPVEIATTWREYDSEMDFLTDNMTEPELSELQFRMGKSSPGRAKIYRHNAMRKLRREKFAMFVTFGINPRILARQEPLQSTTP